MLLRLSLNPEDAFKISYLQSELTLTYSLIHNASTRAFTRDTLTTWWLSIKIIISLLHQNGVFISTKMFLHPTFRRNILIFMTAYINSTRILVGLISAQIKVSDIWKHSALRARIHKDLFIILYVKINF